MLIEWLPFPFQSLIAVKFSVPSLEAARYSYWVVLTKRNQMIKPDLSIIEPKKANQGSDQQGCGLGEERERPLGKTQEAECVVNHVASSSIVCHMPDMPSLPACPIQ